MTVHNHLAAVILPLLRPLMLATIFMVASFQPSTAQPYAVPEETVLTRLVWTTMVTVDNANRTGDYSVLLALGAPSFQANNSEEDLATLFASLRENRVDIGKAILIEPTWLLEPAVNGQGILRLRGGFEYRPRAIRFDILFQNVGGGWRILGLSVAELSASSG